MITITIGESVPRKWEDVSGIDRSWINQQINKRLKDGSQPCIEVLLEGENATIRVATPECGGGGGGGRPPNATEQEIIENWRDRVLSKDPIVGGHVISFLESIHRLL